MIGWFLGKLTNCKKTTFQCALLFLSCPFLATFYSSFCRYKWTPWNIQIGAFSESRGIFYNIFWALARIKNRLFYSETDAGVADRSTRQTSVVCPTSRVFLDRFAFAFLFRLSSLSVPELPVMRGLINCEIRHCSWEVPTPERPVGASATHSFSFLLLAALFPTP